MKNKTFLQRAVIATRYAFGLGSGYDATKQTRYREQKRLLGGIHPEDRELPLGDRLALISVLLDMRRNNPIMKAICRLREEDVVGSGLKPRPDSGDQVLDDELVSWWDDYADTAEVSGLTMMETQKLLASMTLVHGDGGLLLLDDGKFQLIAGEQIGVDTPAVFTMKQKEIEDGIIDGLEISETGEPLFYHIGTIRDEKREKTARVPAENFVHHTKRFRAGQLRGVPELATAVDAMMDIQEYENIEMLSAKASASFSAAVKKENSLDFELGAREEEGRLEYLEPGRVHYLEPGEDISVISSNGRPNVDAIDWLIYKMRKVGATVGIPTEYLLMTIGETSFSASQGMVLLYQNTIEAEQRYISQTLNKLWSWRLSYAISNKEISIPDSISSNLSKIYWQPPAFRWINRSSQVNADQLYLQMGAMSLENISTQFGMSPKEVFQRKAKEIKKAKEIAEKHEIDNWRDLYSPITIFGNYTYEPTVEKVQPEENEENINGENIQ